MISLYPEFKRQEIRSLSIRSDLVRIGCIISWISIVLNDLESTKKEDTKLVFPTPFSPKITAKFLGSPVSSNKLNSTSLKDL